MVRFITIETDTIFGYDCKVYDGATQLGAALEWLKVCISNDIEPTVTYTEQRPEQTERPND